MDMYDTTVPVYIHIPSLTAGPRMCIGNRFALTEMKIATAMTLKNFR